MSQVTAEEGEGKTFLAIYIVTKGVISAVHYLHVLAVDIMHGRGPSSKMRPQLQPKKNKVRLN